MFSSRGGQSMNDLSSATRALHYVETVMDIARRANLPGHSLESWNALAPLVAAGAFRLTGPAKQALDWPATLTCLESWARAGNTGSVLRRLEEAGALAFMERDEPVTGQAQTRRTMTVFEFDAAGRLCRLDVFH